MTDKGLARMSDGASIAWRIEGPGDAPVLVLSNSLGTTHAMWNRQIESFSARYRVLRYDTRGHGGSAVMPGAYSLDRLGRDVPDLLDALDIEKAHFCGLSLGGMTGQWLGVHAPDRLGRLILANTAPFMGPPAAWQQRIEAVSNEAAGGMADIADAVIERWFTPKFRAADPDTIGVFRSELLACPAQGYAGCCAAIRDMDLRPVIGLIRCPTLVISGGRDPATPPAQGAAIAGTIAQARSVVLDAAHLSNVEQQTAFTAAVLDFLG